MVDRLAEHLKRSTKLFLDGPKGTVAPSFGPPRKPETASPPASGLPDGPVPRPLAHCWAHGGRQLRELFDRDGSAVAEAGLKRVAELYAIEADLRGQPPEARRAVRQERAKPLVEVFGVWLAGWRARLSAKSCAGEKLAYFANHRDGLCVDPQDGRVEIDSNAVENTTRPIALGRKKARFAGHDEVGRAWGRIASLIETAKMNGVEPFAYLAATLDALADGHPRSRLDELRPWNSRPASS